MNLCCKILIQQLGNIYIFIFIIIIIYYINYYYNLIRDAISEAPETHYRPIRIANDKPERVYAQDLIVTDNELLQKVLTVLVFLCDESKELKEIAETKLYGPLTMCGQIPPDISEIEIDKKNKKKDVILSNTTAYREKMMGNFLLTLQEVSNFVDRCYEVVINMIQQMSSLLSPKEALYRASFQTTHLLPFVKCLGELLTVLITLDNIIQQNDLLLEAWTYYKTTIGHLRADPTAFGTDEAGVTKFERLLVSLESTLMTEEIFKGCIEQDFETSSMEDDDNNYIKVRENSVFLTELLYCLKTQLDNSLSIIGTNVEVSERYDVVGSIALYALYRRLLPANIAPDAKLHKALWSVQKQIPLVVLCERVVWNFGEFVSTYANFEIKKPDPANPEVYRREYIAKFDSLLSQRTASVSSQCAAWMVLAESRVQPSLRHENNNSQALDIRGSILLKGLALASRASYLAKSCLVMHYTMQIPMSKANLNDISILIEYLKAIEFTFIRKDSIISENLSLILSISSQEILDCIQPLRIKLQASRKLDPSKNDLLSSLFVIENLVRASGSYTQIRLYTILLTVEIVAGSKLFNEAGGNKLRSSVKRLSALANLSHNIRQVCSTSFLYFHLSILDPIVANIYQHPTQANRLQYIIAAFNDGIRLFSLVSHAEFFPFYVNYRSLLRYSITSEIIEPLCRDIETDLRLHIHTKHLDHMEALNPKSENLKTLRSLLDIAPIRMLGLIVNIKNEVTHYLDLNFYNLTTIALHDWRTYSDMRALALEKLGIQLMDNFLPMGSLDQGLDVLQIMRNIHVFVSRFTYNMNTQQFIEYRPDKASKHLNTIKIQSIAASIRQHGLGVLNTTVNFTYQFLAQKFHTFSQFLFDDYIKAHLSREHRWFKKHRNDPEINHMYPYERSLKFVRDIRKLGVGETGKTFLDQFRILITEIGNALGYVRMVRSASMFYCSEAVKYLPDMDNIIR
jgi:WASH complex subunit 7